MKKKSSRTENCTFFEEGPYNHGGYTLSTSGCHDILLLGKSHIKWRQHPDMTLAVDCDVKPSIQTHRKCIAIKRFAFICTKYTRVQKNRDPGSISICSTSKVGANLHPGVFSALGLLS